MVRTDWFERWAQYTPDSVALVDQEGGREFTYARCFSIINRLANVLRDDYGIAQGDRIAVLAMNEVEYVFLFYAAQKCLAILVPVNYRLAPPEIAHVLKDCDPALFVVQQQYMDAATRAMESVAPLRVVPFDGGDGLAGCMYEQSRSDSNVPMSAELDTPCMILYTSGTTGAPKGAIITHGMLFWNSINTTMRLNLTQQDVTLTFAPFFHTGGWNVLTTPFLHRGAKLVLLRRFDPGLVLRLCDELQVSILFGVPTMMDMLARDEAFEASKLFSVRYAIVGGEPMPVDLIRLWQNKGVPIRQGYGLTEFGPNVFSLNEEDAVRKIGSIGFPNFYIDAKVVNDDGLELGSDEVGELLLRGPVCTPGYWHNDAATSAAIQDGWFRTGDLVRRDADGYYFVVDRKKDMFISGAENVYPAEIEHVLRSHPDIEAAAVVGVADPIWGESGKAFIVLRPGATLTREAILDYCRERLAKFKIPKHVAFLDALPLSDSGKILKKQLRSMSHDGTDD